MEPFCSNPLCPQHRVKVEPNQHTIRVRDEHGDRDLDRHMYVDMNGKKFEVCSICNNAIQLLRGE